MKRFILLFYLFNIIYCYHDYRLVSQNPGYKKYLKRKYNLDKKLPEFKFREIYFNETTKNKNTNDYFNNKKCILFGLPGAFISNNYLQDYERLYNNFTELGIDEIYCLSVNDVFVIKKWRELENINNVKMIADNSCSFTKSIGMNITWNSHKELGERCCRFSAYIDNNVIVNKFIEKPFNKSLDSVNVSDAQTMLNYLKTVL
jgi:peroxiredoxin